MNTEFLEDRLFAAGVDYPAHSASHDLVDRQMQPTVLIQGRRGLGQTQHQHIYTGKG